MLKKIGVGENNPKSIVLQWRNWCLNKGYMKFEMDHDYLKSTYDKYSNQIKPLLTLLNFYLNAEVEQIMLNPHNLGLKKIGHVDFLSRKYKKSI